MIIGGTKFHDQNEDGIRQSGEPGLSGWLIELDLHADGSVDYTRTTDSEGRYRFEGIGPGNPDADRRFLIRERPVPGWEITTPLGNSHLVDIRSGLNRTDFDFGNAVESSEKAKICGTKFEDLDGDGVRDTQPNPETGLAGWTIRLSGPEGSQQAVTGEDGSYCFENLEPGSYEVSEITRDGWIVTTPSNNLHQVNVENENAITGLDFGNFKLGLIAGVVFDDSNQNAQLDAGESKLAGWTVFIDSNNDGVLNNPSGNGACTSGAQEICVVTGDNGSYAFTRLRKAPYIVRQVQQPGWNKTTQEFYSLNLNTSGKSFQGINFGNAKQAGGQITGQVFFDRNSSGVRDLNEAGIPGWTVFIDDNNDGSPNNNEIMVQSDAAGNFLFQGLSAGQKTIRAVAASSWRQTLPVSGLYQVNVTTNGSVGNINFGYDLITPYELYLPFFRGDQDSFTGFAFSNYSDQGAYLEFSSFEPDGSYSDYSENPASLVLGPHEQEALLGFEIFEVDPSTVRKGWVRVVTDNPEIASFFMYGGSKKPFLDGSIAFSEQHKNLYFSRILEGTEAFRDQSTETLISLANPNPNAIKVQFTLFVPQSGFVFSLEDRQNNLYGVTKTIPGYGALIESISTLFDNVIQNLDSDTLASAYLEARVTEGDGAVGFQLVRKTGGETVFGLNALPGNQNRLSFSAQLAHSDTFFTNLRLINVGDRDRSIKLSAVAENGELLASSINISLDSEESLSGDIHEIFDFAGEDAVGSIRIEADGEGIIGDVVFGDPKNLKFAAAMPLQNQALTKAVFSQVANIAGYFTGLAFYNPGIETASVTVTVFQNDGDISGKTTISLEPGQRLSRLLVELVPSTAGQDRGFIQIQSNQPLIAQQFFGDSNLNLLSSVPPTLVETAAVPLADSEVEETEPNGSVSNADLIEIGQTGLGTIDPDGDRDLWRFEGNEGTRVVIQIEAESEGSFLDSLIALYVNEDRDNDGFLDLIEQNDDADQDTLDSRIELVLPETNTYIILIQDVFNEGSEDFFYSLVLQALSAGN
jgi:hypothetical protein